jgi:hypothetical protein
LAPRGVIVASTSASGPFTANQAPGPRI